ncbi:MAG: hypothetical protein Q7P63_11360 [Verrucomicrobiota bacterium JB022]|nr:hypothetical protein [Verrucomicrobiota bacterium JB022]
MSLINEALKKAQADQARQNTGPGGQGPQQTAGMLVPNRSGGGGIVIGIVVGALVAALVTGGILWLVLRQPAKPAPEVAQTPPPVAAPATVQTPAREPAVAVTTPPPAPVAEAEPAPLLEPIRYTPLSAQQPEPPTHEPAPQAIAPAPAQPVAVQPPAAAPEPTRTTQLPEVAAYIANIEVRGVMSGGSKILLFDPAAERSRAFAVGDVVSLNPQITIAEIAANQVKFHDHGGVTYTKRY